MKQGGNRKTAGGFTIVETLIVLAISSTMLVAVVALISGRQARTEFQTGINGLQQQVQQIVNETATGYSTASGNFSCTAAINRYPDLSSTASSQGTNGSCVFIGKAIQFGSGTHSSSGGHNTSFTIYPLAANRLQAGKEVTTIIQAAPTPVAPGFSTNTDAPDNSDVESTKNGLTFQWSYFTLASGLTTQLGDASVIAFISSLGSYDVNGLLNSGSQQFNLYAVPNTPTANTNGQTVDVMNSNPTPYQQITSARLCFASGGTDQSGLITIGGNGGLDVSLRIYDTNNCGGAA